MNLNATNDQSRQFNQISKRHGATGGNAGFYVEGNFIVGHVLPTGGTEIKVRARSVDEMLAMLDAVNRVYVSANGVPVLVQCDYARALVANYPPNGRYCETHNSQCLCCLEDERRLAAPFRQATDDESDAYWDHASAMLDADRYA